MLPELLAGAALLLAAVAGAAPVPVGPEFQVNTHTSGRQNDAAVATDPSGRFVVVWASDQGPGDTDVQGQRYDAAGVPEGGEFQANTYTTGGQGLPAVASDAAGNFVIVWTSYADEGMDPGGSIRARRYDATGTPLGDQFAVNTYTTSRQSEPAVAMHADGFFVVVWPSLGSASDTAGNSVQARFYDPAGIPMGDQLQASTYTTGEQDSPAVTIDPLGRVLVVWDSGGSSGSDSSAASIQARRFDRLGTPLGPEFQVNSYTTGYQTVPAVAVDALGNFVVSWNGGQSAGSDTDQFSVQARRLDGSATPQDVEFQVNSYTTQNQVASAVAASAAGDFLVVWMSGSSGETNSNFVVRGRHHDATGAPTGEEFAVSTYTTADPLPPSVAPTPGGGFVVVWGASGSTGSDTSVGSAQVRLFAEPTTTTSTPSPGATTTSTLAPQPVAGAKLLIGDRGTTDRRLTVRIGDATPATFDPTASGALLHVHGAGGTADNACFALPAVGWRSKGRPRGRRWVFDGCSSGQGPCVRALLRPGKRFAAKSRGALAYSLDEPQQTAVGVRFGAGGTSTCALFGGRLAKDRGGTKGRFTAKDAPAPATCAPAPAPCP